MEFEEGEMALPINSTYGGGHGHMIHHESAPHNHIVPSSATAAAEAAVVVVQQQQMPITNGPTIIVPPPPPSSSSMEDTVVPYTNNNNNTMRMVIVRYRECLKNHAASIGGNATDGCGEFLPSGEDGTLEALTCSACNCHRNFHRKEIEGDYYNYNNYHSTPPHLNRSLVLGNGGRKVIFQGHHHHHHIESFPSRPPPMMMSYNHMASESDEMVMKKRFRTKFTQQQKEKMLGFAEKVGWKFQKQDESDVQQFCQELGIKRRVLKVWMHNNKHTLAKKINPIPADPQNQINNN